MALDLLHLLANMGGLGVLAAGEDGSPFHTARF
jgi:hypothetical protein